MSLESTPIVFGNARFSLYSAGCLRLEYANGAKFSPYASLLTGGRAARAQKAKVSRKGKLLRIKTEQFELRYTDNGECFSADNLKITHKNAQDHKTVWVPGKEDRGNLGTVLRCLDQWKWCGGPEHFPVQGILSTDGGHFLEDVPRVYWNKKYDWPECRASTVQYDGYFFAYGRDYKGALGDFVKVLGPVPMVPRWAFGFWYSRWYAYKDRELVELARRYRKEGIPIDVMIIDTDWRDGWGGYDWSRKYFPKPEKTLRELRAMNLRASLNDHPGYGNFDALPENDSHIPAIGQRLGALPHQGAWACDWSNKKAVRAWRDVLLGPFFDQGMDFWWIDGWIKSPFGSLDSQLWANRQYFELAEEKTGKRGLILSRWGGIGSHRYPVQFSGDTPSEWDMLRRQIEFTARSGNLGAAYWSHDIGGFFGRKIDEELLIRWMQFGAMSPILRTHSDHGIREPWHYSKQAIRLFRKQTRIRYALAPYFYTLAHEAHETGLPLIRPLYLEYNDFDGGALNKKHQYTIGRDLLVIPADGPVDARTKRYRKQAYFPNETWHNLETDETVTGMLDGYVEAPIDQIPTYVRKGAIIPCQEVGDHLGTQSPRRIQFDYYPDDLKASAYVLYEDDGESKKYENGEFALTTVGGKRTGQRIEMSVSRPKGAYRGMPKEREYVLRARLLPGERVDRAECRVDREDWQPCAHRVTTECLAGTVKGQHPFCEVAVVSSLKPCRVRMMLK